MATAALDGAESRGLPDGDTRKTRLDAVRSRIRAYEKTIASGQGKARLVPAARKGKSR
jgi:hypothetical protein